MVDDLDFNQFQNQKVIIKGCASVMVPTWAYLILVSRVAQVANKIYYGEPRYAVKIFDKMKYEKQESKLGKIFYQYCC